MARSKWILVFAFGLIASAVNAAEYRPGEIIVKYKDGVVRDSSLMNDLYRASGAKRVRRLGRLMKGFEQITLQKNVRIQDAVRQLERSGTVEYVQPNYILHAFPARAKPRPQEDPAPPGGGIPCIPGFDIPGCDPNLPLPCLVPGYPPGCEDGGGDGGGGGGGGGNQPPTPPAPNRPALKDRPAEVIPPVADPDLTKAYGLAKIGATTAWDHHPGDKRFVVAVIDTGIDYNHPDLSFNVWRNPRPTQNDLVGFDFIHNDGLPYDDQGHGTHTSGTVGATGGNGIGVSGVNQRVSIMGVKFLSAEGSGTTADAIRSIDYAINNGARVLSNSWGGTGDDDNKALYEAIERAKAKDVLFIAAAGNDGANNDDPAKASYPAAFDNDNLIAVAATDSRDKMAFFSNFGKKTVHLGAPGVNVYSLAPGGKYASQSGTSMACPHVAGAAALLWSKHPNWTYKEVKNALLSSVDPIPSLSGKTITGGRLNVLKALQAGVRSR